MCSRASTTGQKLTPPAAQAMAMALPLRLLPTMAAATALPIRTTAMGMAIPTGVLRSASSMAAVTTAASTDEALMAGASDVAVSAVKTRHSSCPLTNDSIGPGAETLRVLLFRARGDSASILRRWIQVAAEFERRLQRPVWLSQKLARQEH